MKEKQLPKIHSSVFGPYQTGSTEGMNPEEKQAFKEKMEEAKDSHQLNQSLRASRESKYSLIAGGVTLILGVVLLLHSNYYFAGLSFFFGLGAGIRGLVKRRRS